MPYKTVIVPDEKMPVFSEKSLDDKFKPEAEWRTTFLTGKEANREIIGETGDLKDGVLKIKTHLDLGSEMRHKIPILIYPKASQVKDIMEREKKSNKDFDKLSLIREYRGMFSIFGPSDLDKFYECGKCGGYVAGNIEAKEYDDLGPLCGSAGTEYNCPRCGTTLARHACIYA